MAKAKKAIRKGKAKPAAKATRKLRRADVKIPTARQVAELVGLALEPPLPTARIRRLRRALPGYVSMLDDVAELVRKDAAELNLKEVTPEALLDAQARQKALSARETVLETVYTSAYHQRLVVDDEAMGMLRAIARRVQSRAEENPDLPLRYKAMLDFLATFQGGRRPAAPQPSAPQ
jgi:hypothetical protein